MSDETYLDDTRDPLAESGSRAARFAGGTDELESAPAPHGAESGRELGSIVANRYVLKAHLGSGRYGEIYAAVDRSLSDPQLGLEHRVALHLLHRRISLQTRLLRKLESSYQQTHLWAHPNVVKVQGFGCDRGRYFLVMELLDGVSLRSLLDMQSERPSDTEAFAALRAVGDALKYAHAKGAIHGDIRPEKIFITKDSAVKVLDLLPASSPRTRSFFVEDAGPDSLAPPDPRDDVYGLACVAYELLAGSHPFNGRSPLEAWNTPLTLAPIPRLGARQWDALARGLALRREQRTASVATFLAELGVTGEEAPARANGTTRNARPSASASARPTRVQDDDLPIIGDYSGDWDVRALRAQPPPSQPRRAANRASDAPLRVDPQDVRRHAELARLREPRRVGLGLASVVLIAAAVAVYSNYEPLRSRAVEWLANARLVVEDSPAGGAEMPPRSEPAAIEVVTPAVVATPDPPSEAPDLPPVTAAIAERVAEAPPSEGSAPEVSAPDIPAPERFELTATSAVFVSEGEAVVTVPIRHRGGDLGESFVVWWTSDGSASAGEDYADLGPTIEKFAAGAEVRTIYIPIVGDSNAEGRESFYVNLGASAQPAAVLEPAQRIEIVVDDDD